MAEDLDHVLADLKRQVYTSNNRVLENFRATDEEIANSTLVEDEVVRSAVQAAFHAHTGRLLEVNFEVLNGGGFYIISGVGVELVKLTDQLVSRYLTNGIPTNEYPGLRAVVSSTIQPPTTDPQTSDLLISAIDCDHVDELESSDEVWAFTNSGLVKMI